MSTDLVIAVLSLASLQIGLVAWLRMDMKELRQEMNALRKDTSQIRERMAHLEGLLEGLREAIVSRATA